MIDRPYLGFFVALAFFAAVVGYAALKARLSSALPGANVPPATSLASRPTSS